MHTALDFVWGLYIVDQVSKELSIKQRHFPSLKKIPTCKMNTNEVIKHLTASVWNIFRDIFSVKKKSLKMVQITVS